MKSYQDHDPLHGHGKAMPKPKRPTKYTYRGGSLGFARSYPAADFKAKREAAPMKTTASGKSFRDFSVVSLVMACLGLQGGYRRGAFRAR